MRRFMPLVAEFAIIYFALPAFFYFHAARWSVHVALWLVCLYALFTLRRDPGFSWTTLWHGKIWPGRDRWLAVIAFALSVPLAVMMTAHFVPERLFAFPAQRPFFWLVVMALYPLLSALPQELVFRSFFFRRYGPVLRHRWLVIAASTACFGGAHVVMHNWIAPLLSTVAGLAFSLHYDEHRSLKWAAIEHAAYGCMIFTVGIGIYFLVNGMAPR